MLCPKCNKKMKVMTLLDFMILADGSKDREVIGRCEDCDFDATWVIVTDVNGDTKEYDFERYFFG